MDHLKSVPWSVELERFYCILNLENDKQNTVYHNILHKSSLISSTLKKYPNLATLVPANNSQNAKKTKPISNQQSESKTKNSYSRSENYKGVAQDMWPSLN